MNIYRAICLIYLIAVHGQVLGESSDENSALINKLNSRDFKLRTEAILKVHQEGKEALPLLLEHVGDCDVYPPSERGLGFQDIFSTKTIPAKAENNCSGVIYAYTIELILAGHLLIPTPEGGDLRVVHNCAFYVYEIGLIVTKEEKALTARQMAEVKKIYQDWYEKNRGKTIEQLRADWEVGMTPLAGSAYHWR